MIWFTWRQFRTQTWITIGGLAALAIVLAISGHHLADIYAANVAGCHSDCGGAISNFLQQAENATSGRIYNAATAVMYVVPALIGIFWGAPLIAHELETGTHRLAWNQSITRTRWLAVKFATIGVAAMATMGLLSLAVTAWAHHIDHATMDRITPLLFGARGVVPIAYAAFAFTLGVTAGMLIRRTVPAMATTLVVYIAAVLAAPTLRAHLIPPRHLTALLDTSKVHQFMINRTGGMHIVGAGPSSGWVMSNQTVTSTGHLFTGPASPEFCNPNAGLSPRSCMTWVDSLHLHEDITYQPASHFWPLQWSETGMFLALSVLLAGFCFWWTRRRLT